MRGLLWRQTMVRPAVSKTGLNPPTLAFVVWPLAGGAAVRVALLSHHSARTQASPRPCSAPSSPGLRASPNGAALLRAGGLTGAGFVVSLVRDMALAATYGRSASLDVFFVALGPTLYWGTESANLAYLTPGPANHGSVRRRYSRSSSTISPVRPSCSPTGPSSR